MQGRIKAETVQGWGLGAGVGLAIAGFEAVY
jgi:hypothetical protein